LYRIIDFVVETLHATSLPFNIRIVEKQNSPGVVVPGKFYVGSRSAGFHSVHKSILKNQNY